MNAKAIAGALTDPDWMRVPMHDREAIVSLDTAEPGEMA
ncbi:hypothetical protein PCE31107_03013 [Pandoraea cepalis]|uniref:Uncharacterized protein n=2 Tax=Pandoraea TaxID=93217 RepID=A0A5E4XIL5_9BURK|nr:hypothetical protein PCE31107_03013 [Pandoraea cepalis]VVE36133.1 hypothetical protein PTE31013_03934 [Pandoraea terrigena]